MKQSRQEIAVILVTVALLVIVAVVFVVIFGQFSNWYSTDYSPIYLTCGKIKFFNDNDGLALGDAQFKVHNLWASNKKYTVQVLPTGEDFLYQLEGEWYSYLDTVKDLTAAFNVDVDGSKFTIHAKGLSVRQILSKRNNGKDVMIASAEVYETIRYKLVVSTLDGKHSVTVTFRCINSVGVDRVEMDPSGDLIF